MKNGTAMQRRRPGRPSKLTPQTMALILAAIKCGASNKIACAAADIRPETLCAWKRRAEERPDSEYAQFAQQLTRARDEGRVSRLAIIHKAAKMDWRAAAWLLERDMPDEFSMRYKIEHSMSGEVTLADALRALRTDRPAPKQIEGEKIEEAEQW